MGTELEVREQATSLVRRAEPSVDDLADRVEKIAAVRARLMKDEIHYGTIPGTSKPTLLKAGAEMLCEAFMLAPHFRTEKIWHEDGHLDVTTFVTIVHIPTGAVVVEDIEGFCSTRESKYGTRNAQRVCPVCGAAAIRKNKDGKTWQCMGFNDLGGCWEKFPIDDPQITEQDNGKVVNPDIADTYNTVLKMSQKRALIAGALIATGTSSMFTQDVEDMPELNRPPRQQTRVVAEAQPEQVAPVDGAAPAGTADEQHETTKVITEAQRRLLFAKAKEQEIGNDDLHDLIYAVTHKTHTNEIEARQFEELLDAVSHWTEA